MVEIEDTGTGGRGEKFAKLKGCPVFVEAAALHSLPAPDPHQALRDAVVEAAIEQERIGVMPSAGKPADDDYHWACKRTNDAVRALRAALRAALSPPDPALEAAAAALWPVIRAGLGELIRWDLEWTAVNKGSVAHDLAMDAARAALEAARKAGGK